jgi:hypothetical protein
MPLLRGAPGSGLDVKGTRNATPFGTPTLEAEGACPDIIFGIATFPGGLATLATLPDGNIFASTAFFNSSNR